MRQISIGNNRFVPVHECRINWLTWETYYTITKLLNSFTFPTELTDRKNTWFMIRCLFNASKGREPKCAEWKDDDDEPSKNAWVFTCSFVVITTSTTTDYRFPSFTDYFLTLSITSQQYMHCIMYRNVIYRFWNRIIYKKVYFVMRSEVSSGVVFHVQVICNQRKLSCYRVVSQISILCYIVFVCNIPLWW